MTKITTTRGMRLVAASGSLLVGLILIQTLTYWGRRTIDQSQEGATWDAAPALAAYLDQTPLLGEDDTITGVCPLDWTTWYYARQRERTRRLFLQSKDWRQPLRSVVFLVPGEVEPYLGWYLEYLAFPPARIARSQYLGRYQGAALYRLETNW